MAQQALTEIQIDGAQVLVGVFNDQRGAERAEQALKAAGISGSNVKVLAKPGAGASAGSGYVEAQLERASASSDDGGGRINIGTGVGIVAGAIGGATTGLAVMVLPGLDSLLGSIGHVGTMGIFGVIGAILGGWGGSVAGSPAPEEDLSYFTGDLDKGATLVAVRTNRIDEVIDILHDAGARNLQEGLVGH